MIIIYEKYKIILFDPPLTSMNKKIKYIFLFPCSMIMLSLTYHSSLEHLQIKNLDK